MKKALRIFSLSLLIASSAFASIPAETESEKTKTYSKTYALGSGDKVLLDNKFGDMKISTWDKNEVKVDVTINVKGGSETQVQRVIDAISINDGKNGSEVFFRTKFKKDDNDNESGPGDNNDKKTFRINYTVFLPSAAALSASNVFGDITMGDYNGPLTIECKFGSFFAGTIMQAKKLLMQFGKKISTIEAVNNGKISVQFCQAQINKLSGEITADLNQSHGTKIKVDNSIRKLDLNNNFSEVQLELPRNLGATVKVSNNYTKYRNETSFTSERTDQDDSRFDFRSNYLLKSGNGNVQVDIRNNFGKLTLAN